MEIFTSTETEVVVDISNYDLFRLCLKNHERLHLQVVKVKGLENLSLWQKLYSFISI